MKSQINVGIIGLGVVGCGALKILLDNKKEIERKIGSRLEVIKIADKDLTTNRPVDFDRSILTSDVNEVVANPDVDIVIELIGGVHPAKEFILQALYNGKHVVTANKELIAKEGSDLLSEALNRKLDFCFEGSVGGGIPIIHPMKTSLAGNNIIEVIGIVNGTTNYILTKMAEENSDFSDVLAEAQKAGYAEFDPTSDVEGYDAKYKLAILASIAFTSKINLDDVYCEGITKISQSDLEYAKELGYTIKLLAIAKHVDEKIEARVHPTLIPLSHPLANVNNVYNGIYVKGDFVQDVMFYGRGAGSHPTGSAVAGDVIDIARNINYGSNGKISCTCFDKREIHDINEVVTRYYIRLLVSDKPKVLAAIASIFGDNNVSIALMNQKNVQGDKAEIVMVTHDVVEIDFRNAIEQIAKLPVVAAVCNWIRVEE